LVVGTILTVINQGDAILTATLTPVLLWKIPLTYVVPFAVSTYSAFAISCESQPRGVGPEAPSYASRRNQARHRRQTAVLASAPRPSTWGTRLVGGRPGA
jgi:hypothetical protein